MNPDYFVQADYNAGVDAARNGEPMDETKGESWVCGYLDVEWGF